MSYSAAPTPIIVALFLGNPYPSGTRNYLISSRDIIGF